MTDKRTLKDSASLPSWAWLVCCPGTNLNRSLSWISLIYQTYFISTNSLLSLICTESVSDLGPNCLWDKASSRTEAGGGVRAVGLHIPIFIFYQKISLFLFFLGDFSWTRNIRNWGDDVHAYSSFHILSNKIDPLLFPPPFWDLSIGNSDTTDSMDPGHWVLWLIEQF